MYNVYIFHGIAYVYICWYNNTLILALRSIRSLLGIVVLILVLILTSYLIFSTITHQSFRKQITYKWVLTKYQNLVNHQVKNHYKIKIMTYAVRIKIIRLVRRVNNTWRHLVTCQCGCEWRPCISAITMGKHRDFKIIRSSVLPASSKSEVFFLHISKRFNFTSNYVFCGYYDVI